MSSSWMWLCLPRYHQSPGIYECLFKGLRFAHASPVARTSYRTRRCYPLFICFYAIQVGVVPSPCALDFQNHWQFPLQIAAKGIEPTVCPMIFALVSRATCFTSRSRRLVLTDGLKPSAAALSERCSIQLSYINVFYKEMVCCYAKGILVIYVPSRPCNLLNRETHHGHIRNITHSLADGCF